MPAASQMQAARPLACRIAIVWGREGWGGKLGYIPRVGRVGLSGLYKYGDRLLFLNSDIIWL